MNKNLILKNIALLLLLGEPLFANEGQTVSSKENSSISTKKDEKLNKNQNKYNILLNATHVAGYNESIDPITSLSVTGTMKVYKNLTLGITQPFTKAYVKNEGEDEFLYHDTIISASYTPNYNFLGWNNNYTATLTLPISEASRDQDVITTAGITPSFSKNAFEDKISLVFAPTFRYYWNEYTTTRTNRGDNGGNPMPIYKWGLSFSGAYSIDKVFSLLCSIGYSELQYHHADKDDPTDGGYKVSMIVNAKANEDLSISIGHTHGDTMELTKDSRVYLYDKNQDQYFLSVSYKVPNL